MEKKHENILIKTNLAPPRKDFKIIRRKFIISSISKMKPPLNTSKKTKTIRASTFENLSYI